MITIIKEQFLNYFENTIQYLQKNKFENADKMLVIIEDIKASNPSTKPLITIKEKFEELKQEMNSSFKDTELSGQIEQVRDKVFKAFFFDSLLSDKSPTETEQEIFKTLIPSINQTTAIDQQGNPLILLCAKSAEEFYRQQVTTCLSHSANPNFRDDEGITVLEYLSAYGEAKEVEMLLAKGASIEQSSRAFALALEHSCDNNVLLHLIQAGASLTQKNEKGIPLWKVLLEIYSVIVQHVEKGAQYMTNTYIPMIKILALFLSKGIGIEDQKILLMLDVLCKALFYYRIGDWSDDKHLVATAQWLIEQGQLPLIFSKGRSLVVDIMHHGPQVLKDLLKLQKDQYAAIEKSHESLSQLYESLNEDGVLQLIQLAEKAAQALDELEKYSSKEAARPPNQHLAKTRLSLEQRLEQINRLSKSIDPNTLTHLIKFQYVNGVRLEQSCLRQDASDLCFYEKNYLKLPYLLAKNQSVCSLDLQRAKFGILLDKCPDTISAEKPQHIMEGSAIDSATSGLLEAFDYMRTIIKTEPLSIIIENLIKSYGFLINTSATQTDKEKKSLNRWAFQILNDPSARFPILYPTGYIHHTVLVSIERNWDDDTVDIILYNTGDGVEKHAMWKKEGRRYQTHFGFKNVPMADLSDDFLTKLLSVRNDSTTIEPIYALLELIGKKGTPISASDFKGDYEQIQEKGTCSAQCQLAFLRHYLMTHIPGTPWHKLGVYKEFKAQQLQYLAALETDEVQENLKACIERKQDKCARELQLASFAKNEDLFERAKNSLCTALSEGELDFEEKELLKRLKQDAPFKTPSERFAVLHTMIHSLSYKTRDLEMVQKIFDTPDLKVPVDIIRANMEELQRRTEYVHSVLNFLRDKGNTTSLEEVTQTFKHILKKTIF